MATLETCTLEVPDLGGLIMTGSTAMENASAVPPQAYGAAATPTNYPLYVILIRYHIALWLTIEQTSGKVAAAFLNH